MFRLNNKPSSGLQIQAKVYKMRLILESHYYYTVWVELLFFDTMLGIQLSSYSIPFLKVNITNPVKYYQWLINPVYWIVSYILNKIL
jgi:hypothetical protein